MLVERLALIFYKTGGEMGGKSATRGNRLPPKKLTRATFPRIEGGDAEGTGNASGTEVEGGTKTKPVVCSGNGLPTTKSTGGRGE